MRACVAAPHLERESIRMDQFVAPLKSWPRTSQRENSARSEHVLPDWSMSASYCRRAFVASHANAAATAAVQNPAEQRMQYHALQSFWLGGAYLCWAQSWLVGERSPMLKVVLKSCENCVSGESRAAGVAQAHLNWQVGCLEPDTSNDTNSILSGCRPLPKVVFLMGHASSCRVGRARVT